MKWTTERAGPGVAVMLAALVLASCASLDRQRAGPARFELSYGWYTLDPRSFRMVPVDAAVSDSGLVLVFPTIPGRVMGAPVGEPLRTVPVQADGSFELRLPAALDSRAAPLASATLGIEPADTRLARLGTFHEFPEYGAFRGGGGFIDTRSGDPLVLVYFSNPAHLHGSVRDPTGVYEYDVTVERAGWSWLAVRQQRDGTFRVQAYAGPVGAIEFGVLLPPMMIRGA